MVTHGWKVERKERMTSEEMVSEGTLITPSIPHPHHFTLNLAYVRWTALIPETYCSCASHVGLVYNSKRDGTANGESAIPSLSLDPFSE